jgi:beta-galactosidase
MKTGWGFMLSLIINLVTINLGAQQLYVGANYHPHDDKNIRKIEQDIQLMKAAGMNVVRMAHLAWDSYEPSEGKFDFKWFDVVMNKMHAAGIKVIIDVAIRPAPLWLHQKYPSVSIIDPNGDKQYPNHRYMEDVGDAYYQKYALRYTDSLSRRYANHPALLAFGIDNESGDGRISYSETARQRFIQWLKEKYKTTENLNNAWAGQRWSRKINDFNEIDFPVSGMVNGAPERILDFRRFVSDEINQLLFKVIGIVNSNAPRALLNTNAWYYSPLKYFDYSEIAYSGKMTREGCGFYPGNSLTTNWGLMNALFGISRIQFESNNPFWCSEFTTMTAVPNSIRKSAYASLMYGNQMVCGWTWQSMHAGEEQYLEGMLDWDGTPNRKYDEYKQIAGEFRKIEKFFPYTLKAEVALAFSFPSQIASQSFPVQHDQQLQACFDLFYHRNMDARVVEISRSKLNYKLLLIPGVAVMDRRTASRVREFVQNGGTVIMTSNSAVVDTTGQVFSTTRPGMLSDVFGIRIGSYEETESLNEVSRKGYQGKKIDLSYKGKLIDMESARFDVIEARSATVTGTITSLAKEYPIITSNQYGKGRAIYLGIPANAPVLNHIIDELVEELRITKGPEVPSGVLARKIDKDHYLFLNVTGQIKEISMPKRSRSLLLDKDHPPVFTLAPFEPDFIEIK